ncbi:hypothetical protein JYU34_019124 [Plutella xylostella]|uniref:Myb/SANT-like DNA-binding domain-containing protein n=1 Tax=Plutella xylostella TaxID=51655 RepID=A0ABQ7PW49_PLUXY|nr:hypothetical protein JYU34_019124 [Plutella xylostella]
MNTNNSQNESYWFVVRENQDNTVVLASTNDFPADTSLNPHSRYTINTEDAQYAQLAAAPPPPLPPPPPAADRTMDEYKKFWDRNKVRLLLNLSSDIKYKHNQPFKEKHVWNDIAPLIGTTPEECWRKYVNLKSTFVRMYKKKLLGKEIKWPYLQMCEETFRKCKIMSPDMLEIWNNEKTNRLLELYIENVDKYGATKQLWRFIGATLGVTGANCYKKFSSLKKTYDNILERTGDTGRAVKWPYLCHFQKIHTITSPAQWNNSKTSQLLEAYAMRVYNFVDPKYSKKDLWSEISDMVGESPEDCDKKFRNMKATYIRLKLTGQTARRWRFYNIFEIINKKYQEYSRDGNELCFVTKHRVDSKIKQLLTFYIDNIDKFRNPFVKNKHLWRIIASKLNMDPEDCDKKFRNLKTTYRRLVETKDRSQKINWPYFTYFEQIYGDPDCKSFQRSLTLPALSAEDIMFQEIQKVVQESSERRDRNDKFERLIEAVEVSNDIQRERNRILQALLDRRKP